MAHAFLIQDAEHDTPEPSMLTREEMITTLNASSVHPESPLGRAVLSGRKVFADDKGGTFTTPMPPPAPVAKKGPPAWAQRTIAESSSGHHAPRDIGDAVADELDRQLGRSAALRAARTPTPVATHGRDIGDEVADELERQMFGTVRGVRP